MKNLFMICLPAVFLIIACNGDISRQIMGEWECSRLNQTLEIYPDGRARLIDTKPGYAEYEGTYSIEGKNIVFDFRRFAGPVTRRIRSIENDRLILLDGNGIKEIYSKR